MVLKRKTQSGEDLDGDQSVPLPIQTFFWRQTSPFIRPKQGNLCDASCVSFERVVVQNILHGLSPSLCEAIQSVSRWKVVQAAFPHLMHACSSLIAACKQGNPDNRFGSSETKLLYTLHWIILDAASECDDSDAENLALKGRNGSSAHMHALSTVQLFVYLFAPLIHLLKDADFDSLKLENGLRLWQPLWEYQQPDIPCFATPVKPQRSVLRAQRSQLKVNTNAANIYVGKGTSRENLAFLFDESSSRQSVEEVTQANAPLARMSDICTLTSTADSQTATMEVICENCNTVMPVKSNEQGMVCRCGRKDNFVAFLPDSNNYAFLKLTTTVDKDYVKQKLASAVTSGTRAPGAMDILCASYLDVAVLRCLFCLSWSEDGIYWALRYMHQRMLEVCHEYSCLDFKERARSSSLPVPDLNILIGGKVAPSSEPQSGPTTPTSTCPEVKSPTLKHVPGLEMRRPAMTTTGGFPLPEVRKEPPFKKIRVVDVKHFLDHGKSLLRKKDASDHEGKDDRDRDLDGDGDMPRPMSAMSHFKEHDDRFGGFSLGSCRKSMPTLTHVDKDSVGSSSLCSGQESSTSSQAELQAKGMTHDRDSIKKPIIRITEYSPESKPMHNKGGGSSFNLQVNGTPEGELSESSNLPRSYTDSNIAYKHEGEIQEVSGSKFYILDNGHINYKVVLRALHFVAMNEHAPRICEVLLNLLNCLLDLDIIEAKEPPSDSAQNTSTPAQPSPDAGPSSGANKDSSQGTKPVKTDGAGDVLGKEGITAHHLAMDSLFRIYKALGCPHGCGDGMIGTQGDHLRAKGQNCLHRLHRINPVLFHKFMRDTIKQRPLQETVDFLHAFLGFCIDPVLLVQSPTSQKKSVSQENLPRNGYANNFGHSIGGEGYRGVEGVLLANLAKPLVSRCVECASELYGTENISLFCDVRQLMAYVKEIHGGTFRRVALSGLMDSLQKVRRESAAKKKELALKEHTSNISRAMSVTSESGDEKEPNVQHSKLVGTSHSDEPSTRRKSRKSLFRNKITKSLMFQYAASDSEILDEGPGKSPRTSISAAEEDSPNSTSSIPRRRFSKFNIGWRRGTKSDHEDDQNSDPPPLDRRESRSEIQMHRASPSPRGRMSFRAASQATMTFLSARKRIEDGIKTLGKRMSRKGSSDDFNSHRAAMSRENAVEMALLKEKKLVDKYLIKSGMLRFSFLLECCHPGSLPDPQMVAAMLNLEAPVSARAALLLECAHFIHRCNRGDWPSWMKLNLPSFRHTVAALQNRGQPSGYRRNLMLQRSAGRMFYSWAENLGLQLEYILAKEHADRLAVIDDVKDENRRKELRNEDEEEDFLDEASINPKGKECPYALKMLACLVLLEITTFLRETFQYLPRSRCQKREQAWEKNITSRRFSSIVSSPGHSDKSSESNLADLPTGITNIGSPGDRKISFAVLTERSDSLHSSTASLSMIDPPMGEEKKEKGRRLAQGRQKFLRHFRRGSGHNLSFRRSFKLMRPEGGGGSIKHAGSIKSRKISSHSLQSDGKFVDDDVIPPDDAESVTMMSDDTQESPGEKEMELEDEHMYNNFPWIKVVVQLANLSNFICAHQNYCHPNCYERQRRSCSRLITALHKIYNATQEGEKDAEKQADGRKDNLKLKRRESIFQVTSPSQRRRESTPLLEKIKTDVSITKLKLNSTWKKDDKPREAKEDPPIIKYLTSQAQRLTQCPMAILTKAAPILKVEHFIDIMPVAWELMLESDQELAAAAACTFLLSSAKSSDKARNMIIKELQHEETSQRINALLRFGALWKFRYQVWPRMEEGANVYFKLPPPSIDFTLPSPTIGLPSLTVVDPPWMPHFKTKIEEVTVNQEETKSLVTATTTRRKQQQEMIRKALLAEEERKRVGRENFPMTTVPVTQLAAYEPSLHHGDTEHEEGDEDRLEHGQHLQLGQSVFPSCICAAVLPVLHLLDDHDVNADGVSVAEVAYKIIWECIVDDPILFIRHFLEKLTNKERQEELMFLLRKLILYFPQMPAQAAHCIFNYLIGYIMFYVRTPCEGGQDAIAGALSLLWLAIPSVQGIYFKDLKQTLKKEQCDPYLLVSASVASAKKILVHGPDLSSIPSQLLIQEDTQFIQILQESLEFFNIPEQQHDSFFLVDTKTQQIHSSNAYVRDFYFFRRNFYPQLSLIHMNPDDAQLALQRRVFMLKFVEVGKVLLTNAVMETTPAHQNHVSFLHEELSKLPSFPRKALETEFDMYSGQWGKEIFGMDSLHKYSWAKLMSTVFTSMSSTFTWSNDLSLFINVLNGTIVLQFEDTSILRFCLATLINASRHFKHIFATNGFLYIMPTLLRVYSNNQPNPVLCHAVHFVCKQFYVLHRKPFILQLFGSVAPILDTQASFGNGKDCTKVQPNSLFKLLLALEKYCPDRLSILDLVDGEKPLKALDFCYENDPPDTFNIMDVVSMCVTVIAYAPDSFRSGQMLTVLEMVIPRYLDHIKKETSKKDNATAARAEIQTISHLAVSIRALVMCCESFTRSMSLPQRFLEVTSNPGLKPVHNHSMHSLTVDDREDSHASRHMEEGRRKTHGHEPDDCELREDFRKPRDSLLSISADFYTKCFTRLKELRRILADPAFRPPELLDHKAHNRLAEVAHTLLKLAPYDPITMACTGLQRYMLEILPSTDWSHELIRPGLNLILRRLDRLFTKISKKSALRRQLDWEAAANVLKGVYQTLRKFSFIALLPHLKTLVNILITILLTTSGSASLLPESLTAPIGSHRSEPSSLQTDASPLFVSSVVKLVAMQMQALGDQYSLDQICGGVAAFGVNEKSLNLLINFILPLCIRVGSNCRDTPRMSQGDITFVLTIVTNLLSPSCPSPSSGAAQNNANKTNYLSIGEYGRSGSVTNTDTNKTGGRVPSELHHSTALIGLEILMVCFDKQLSSQWHYVAKSIQAMASKNKVGLPFWKFLDFLVTHRPSLFILLQTFIQFRMLKINCDTAQEYYLQQNIKDKLQGYTFSYHKSASAILVSLAIELRQLRDELANSSGAYRSRAATFATDHSDYSQTQIPDRLPNASITEIAAEIIGPVKSRSSLTKRASRATLFSQSSSNASVPTRTQATLPSGEQSPLLDREKSSKRIAAREGSRILDKFAKKSSLPEDSQDMNLPHSPLLHRQGTIRFRGNLSKQNSLEVEGHMVQVMYENADPETANGRGVVPDDADSLSQNDPRDHRFQRQDAKSRKTFKIKRTKTKTSSSMRPRFMSHRRRPDYNNVDRDGAGSGDGGDDSPSRTAVVFHDRSNMFQLRRHGRGAGIARSVETIPESVEVKSARSKFLQRSRSHDEPSDSPRQREKTFNALRSGRISRKGGRIVRSRSPSVSPPASPQHVHGRRVGVVNEPPPGDDFSDGNGSRRASTSSKLDPTMAFAHSSPMNPDHHQLCPSRDKEIELNLFHSSSPANVTLVFETTNQKTRGSSSSEGSHKRSSDTDPKGHRHKLSPPVETSLSMNYAESPASQSQTEMTKTRSECQLKAQTPGQSGASPIPTRRRAVRGQQGQPKKMLVSPTSTDKPDVTISHFSTALEQIKSYASPTSSPVVIETDVTGGEASSPKESKESPFFSKATNEPMEKDLVRATKKTSTSSEASKTTSSTDSILGAHITLPTRPFPPPSSPSLSPTRKTSYSGSSCQTSPSHVTSFSSSPNDSPVRKPSFSSSHTSPTRKVSYSSSSTMDSPTHKLFFSYRNSPSHRPGYTSPQDSIPRKTSFSSSSFGSPVRKPSFSSSSDSKNKPTYSSTTSSQSSILSSPTNITTRSLISPVSSPSFSRSDRFHYPASNSNRYRVDSPEGNQRLLSPSPTSFSEINVQKYGRPSSPITDYTSSQSSWERPLPHQYSTGSSKTLTPQEKSEPAVSHFTFAPPPSKPERISPTRPTAVSTKPPVSPMKPTSLNLSRDPQGNGAYKVSPSGSQQHPPPKSQIATPSTQSPTQPGYGRSGVRGLVSIFDSKAKHKGKSPTTPSGQQRHSPGTETGSGTGAKSGSNRFSPPAYTYSSPLTARSSHEGAIPTTARPFTAGSPHGNSVAQSSYHQIQNQGARVSPLSQHASLPVDGRSSAHAPCESPPFLSSPISPTSNAYVSRCDSSDSLSANETSSLLRDEQKSGSYNSLYFADEDIPGPI